MKLTKEIYRGGDFSHYVKKYNELGLIVYEKNWNREYHSEQNIYYDDKNRISKILERRSDRSHDEEKLERTYDYDGENYKITEILKLERGINDINNYDNLVLGIQTWHSVDEVRSVHEFKISDGKIKSEKYFDLKWSNNNSVENIYNATGSLEKRTTKTTYTDRKETIIDKYEKDLIVESEHYIDGRIYTVKLIQYLNDSNLILSESIYKYFQEKKYLAFKNNYYYDNLRRLIRIDFLGLFDSELILYNKEENVYSQNRIEKWSSNYHSDDFGFYNLDELDKCRKIEYEEYDEPTKLELLEHWDKYKKAAKQSTVEFFLKVDEVYDSKNNLVQKTTRNANNLNEVYSNSFCHYEYNDEGFIEAEIWFDAEKEFEIEHASTKKYYYT